MRWLALVALVIACGKHEEAPRRDATIGKDAPPIDAPMPKDAAVADAKPAGPKLTVHGKGFDCSLFDDGSVTCTGAIGFGKQTSTPQPAAVPGVNDAKKLYVLGGAACALTGDSAVVCWGDIDDHGRVTTTGAHRVPTPVLGVTRELLDGAVEVAATGDVVCALHEDGKLACKSPHKLCAPKPAKPVKTAKKPKAKPAKKPAAPPPPAEAKPAFEEPHLSKAAHLAFQYGVCVETGAHAIECLDATDGCKSHRVPVKP
jgi:hypothetical protein